MISEITVLVDVGCFRIRNPVFGFHYSICSGMPLAQGQSTENQTTEQLGKCSVARLDWSNDMEKLQRVQRMTYRRMSQIDSELERFEERPELDTRRRHGSLLKRFEELERLHYILRRKQAPNPRQLVEQILAEHAQSLVGQANPSVVSSSSNFNSQPPTKQEYGGILSKPGDAARTIE